MENTVAALNAYETRLGSLRVLEFKHFAEAYWDLLPPLSEFAYSDYPYLPLTYEDKQRIDRVYSQILSHDHLEALRLMQSISWQWKYGSTIIDFTDPVDAELLEHLASLGGESELQRSVDPFEVAWEYWDKALHETIRDRYLSSQTGRTK